MPRAKTMLPDQELHRVRSMSDEALRGELGRAVMRHRQGGLQARPPSVKKLVDEANAWLLAEADKIRSTICNDSRIREIAISEPGATEKLVRVVVDVLSGVFIYVPLGTLAEILVRDGIPKHCAATWAA